MENDHREWTTIEISKLHGFYKPGYFHNYGVRGYGFFSSNDGKNNIIEKFGQAVDESDIFTDDRIIDLIAEFFKKSLAGRH